MSRIEERITVDLIPVGHGNRPGYPMDPEYITVHNTANTNPGANAIMHGRYVKNPGTQVSWHFTVDDERIVQHLPLDENGWHAGDGANGPGNRKSIGIEICEYEGINFPRAESLAAELIAYLMRKCGITITRVVQHNHWSGKNCPRVIRSKPNGWPDFLSMIQQACGSDQGNPAPSYTVQPGDTLSRIADQYGYTVEDLAQENDIADPNLIHPGQIIRFPTTSSDPQPDDPPSDPGAGLTPIMGKTGVDVSQMVAYACQVNPSPRLPYCTLEELAHHFVTEAEVEGVRAEVAWAQSMKETGFFKYGGIVLPEQNNYGGIGALNGNEQGQAASFDTPEIGVRAQIQHLKAYASTESLHQECVDPRFDLVKRGSAPYVEWLGYEDNPNDAGWAWPGDGYGADIVRHMGRIKEQPIKEDEHWGDPFLRRMKSLGLISGDHEPDSSLTWAEFAVVITRLIERAEQNGS